MHNVARSEKTCLIHTKYTCMPNIKYLLFWISYMHAYDMRVMKNRRPPSWRFPCLACGKPVKSNKKGVYCDSCEQWSHSHFSDISDIQYRHLSELGSSMPWYCSGCSLKNLPFADSSFVSDTSSSVL